MTDHLLSEIDADVRAERLTQLWHRYRSTLIFMVAVVLIATAGNSLRQHFRETKGGATLEALLDAQALLKAGKADEAASAFATIASQTNGDNRTLALLWQGRALVAADEKPKAVAVLTHAASATPGLWADVACLRLAALESAAANACLSAKAESPLAQQRQEWLAAIEWQAGKSAEAITLLEEIHTNPRIAEADHERVAQWIATIKAQKKPE